MSVKIGHASIAEHGGTKNGQAGDQTGKEVCTRNWYSKPWQYMLRPTSPIVAEKSAKACEAGCANNRIGYDQNQRNTLRTEARKVNFHLEAISTACETDCSAFMSVCAEAAGVDIPYSGGNAPTTSTMVKAFTSTGQYKAYTDSKYLTSDKYLKRGDILVKPGSHTVMALSDGSGAVVQTSQYSTRDFVKEVQAAIGAVVDGSPGPETQSKLITVSTQKNSTHPVVVPIQKMLNTYGYGLAVDGSYGLKTAFAVQMYQRDIVKATTANQDGIISKGGATWRKLLNI